MRGCYADREARRHTVKNQLYGVRRAEHDEWQWVPAQLLDAHALQGLSRSGTPGPLSKSGSMPETLQSPPANRHAGTGTSYIV